MNSVMTHPIHIVLIEDNRFIRAGWEEVLRTDERFAVCGSFGSCEDALADPSVREADLFLLDIGLPGISGTEAIPFVQQQNPSAPIVMCSVYDDDENIFEALCRGAVGYLLKNTPPDELRRSLHEAVEGGSPMTPSVARKVIASFQRPKRPRLPAADHDLTERENDVLQQMALGKSYAAIAEDLFLSVDGVRYHIRHIYEKLQVHSRAEAVSSGVRKRLIRFPR